MNSSNLLLGLKNLKSTTTREQSLNDLIEADAKTSQVQKELREITGIQTEEDRKRYFFAAGVENWYPTLQDITFETRFIELTRDEMVFIAHHYFTQQQQQEENEFTEETKLKDLNSLKGKLDEAVKHFGIDGVFVKLSSRSPKDSTIILEEARRRFNQLAKQDDDENSRWILLAEQVRLSSKVLTSDRAIQILLDSKRVAEDIKFALMTSKFEPISVVIRKFDPLITPDTEFRGFVWNNQLTCVGQYFHTVVFPHLFNYKEQIEKDLKRFFQTKLNGKIGIPCYMLDLVWFPNGKVLLVEINPFDGEELGAFPASTGLFDWDADRDLMTGKIPFEIRLQSHTKSSSSSKDWMKIVKQ